MLQRVRLYVTSCGVRSRFLVESTILGTGGDNRRSTSSPCEKECLKGRRTGSREGVAKTCFEVLPVAYGCQESSRRPSALATETCATLKLCIILSSAPASQICEPLQ